jgi:hypothetical protein
MFSSVRPRSRFQVVVSKSRFFFHKSVLINKYKEIFGVDISKGVFDVHNFCFDRYSILHYYSFYSEQYF